GVPRHHVRRDVSARGVVRGAVMAAVAAAFAIAACAAQATPATASTGGSAASLTASPASPQYPGMPITLNASATCPGTPEFRFWTRSPGGQWTIAIDYGPSSSFPWQTNADFAGT